MEEFFIYNGRKLAVGTPVLSPASRAFRFGDSLFETMRLEGITIPNFAYHMERLFQGMKFLGFEIPRLFKVEKILEEIRSLTVKNRISGVARVRLTVFRQEGGLYDPVSNHPDYIIECSTLPANYHKLNDNGFVLDILPDNKKGSGPLCNIKSGNYLLYILAAQYARQQKVNECLVLNSNGRIADSSIFNLFIIKNGVVRTPPLNESPVAGVMRRHLLQAVPTLGYIVEEAPLTAEDIESADEVFLSNALYRMRWVGSFKDRQYRNVTTAAIYSKLFQQND